MKAEKTKLQLEFESQTPTIKDVGTLEYLRTFISWFHFKYERLYKDVYNQALTDAANEASIKKCKNYIGRAEWGWEYEVNKDSILKLKK